MTRKFSAFAFSADEQKLVRLAIATAKQEVADHAALDRLLDRMLLGDCPLSEGQAQSLILEQLVRDLLASGYSIDVNDNDGDRETHVEKGTDLAEIMAAIFNEDVDAGRYTLDCCKKQPDGSFDHVGWVLVIDGNGTSVISDYSTVLEPAVAGANALAEMLEDDVA